MKYIINNKYDQYVLSRISEQAAINEKEEAMKKGMQRGYGSREDRNSA